MNPAERERVRLTNEIEWRNPNNNVEIMRKFNWNCSTVDFLLPTIELHWHCSAAAAHIAHCSWHRILAHRHLRHFVLLLLLTLLPNLHICGATQKPHSSRSPTETSSALCHPNHFICNQVNYNHCPISSISIQFNQVSHVDEDI